MTDITIPREALEAAIKAYREAHAITYEGCMSAACKAMLEAWPGAYGNGPRKQWKYYTPAIILPLPKENDNAEG